MSWSPLTQSHPYHWPLAGQWSAADTALLVIDMQADFLSPDGYFARMGNSLEGTRAAIEPLQRVLQAARTRGIRVIYTRESHRPDLTDLSPTKRARAESMGTPIGGPGPLGRFLVRGEPGCDIIQELAPEPGEPVLDKPGNGAFHATDLDQMLRAQGIKHLLITGVTTDVCVHSTLREANDRGYDCLVLEDGCGAGDQALHDAALAMMDNEGGIFGAHASVQALTESWSS
ncbi:MULTISPECIES: cysteine hydrolase family protein [unclassified Marinimicrobium]|jgi:nicotinamidase-related amidase|uniref:cysteine hydrolase family protein n=3 Tax=Marinimicrobium TaxID=359337 RepID=UPI000C3EEBD9|nr:MULTISPECIES: isochorismatase family cysteine hydrolase [unclassified Marinimicrobium]MAN51460.1 cysteine hydrolase [Marinimicrobium sp.]|tara:strand:- start:121 stop:810 length:690 start_codon:yes stop_codon:yes gene_type:complete